MNLPGHYFLTSAVTSEALVARGVDKAHAAITAILVARSNAMVDWWTPERATLDCPATQVDVDDAATVAMVATGRCYPLMSMGHRWHFDKWNGWPEICDTLTGEMLPDADWMRFGAHLHTAQDTDGPHEGYIGAPNNANRLLAIKRRTERGDSVGFWWRMRLSRAASWGHAADPDADKIENCRDGAVKSAVRLFELAKGGVPYPSGPVYSLLAVHDAHNDADLAARCARVFESVTGQPLPEFVPFSGGELATWKEVVA